MWHLTMRARGPSHVGQLILLCTLFVLFAAAIIIAALQIEPLYDESFNASVAKNIAIGLGHLTTYEYSIPHNPRISTGPVLLYPVAAQIAILGNDYWVPQFSAAVVHLALLAVLLWRIWRLNVRGVALCLISLAIVVFPAFFYFSGWILVKGEQPAILLLLLGLSFLVKASISSRDALMCGFLCALSILCKSYAVLSVAGIFCALMWHFFWRSPRALPLICLSFLASLMTPLILWQLFSAYQVAQAAEEVRQVIVEVQEYFHIYSGSGLAQLLNSSDVPGHVASTFQNNIAFLGAMNADFASLPLAGYLGYLLLLVAVLTFLVALLCSRALDNPLLCLAISSAALAHLLWFLFFCSAPNFRYVTIPILLGVVAVVCFSFSRRGYLMLLFAYLPFLWNGTAYYSPAPASFLPYAEPEWQYDYQAVLDYMESNPATVNNPYSGCGWGTPRYIEYLTDRPGQFRDCFVLLRSGQEASSDAVAFRLVKDHLIWAWLYDKAYSVLLQECPQTLFQNERFEIVQCVVARERVQGELKKLISNQRFQG